MSNRRKSLPKLLIILSVAAIAIGLGAVIWHTTHCDKPVDECLVCSTATHLIPAIAAMITGLILTVMADTVQRPVRRSGRFSKAPLPPRAPPILL